MAVALDTLAYARRLREAGFSERQAEGQAEALAAAMTDTLATRQDLRELETRIDARLDRVDARFDRVDARFVQVDSRIDSLERRMDMRFEETEKRMAIRFESIENRMATRADLADLERRMTMRLGGIMAAGVGVVSALVRLL